MPVNRNALIRYKTIDQCLSNRFRQWTLEDLMEACSEALYEFEGIDKGVSRRTIQGDLRDMRSDKLGYNAPIEVVDRKFYTYADPDYRITNSPLNEDDLEKLAETVSFLKQFQGFDHFKSLDAMVQKLEDHVYATRTHSEEVIAMETNEHLVGIGYLSRLYTAIQQKFALEISYQSFKARKESTVVFHPYLLKEFRNRWFLVGKSEKTGKLLILALDRIRGLAKSTLPYRSDPTFPGSAFFDDVIGVTVNEGQNPVRIVLRFDPSAAPYVLTKPMHPSQHLIERDEYGTVVGLNVQWNFELERDILGYGESVQVLEPEALKRKIKRRLEEATDQYNTELSNAGIGRMKAKLNVRGSAVLDQVLTRKSINAMKRILDEYEKRVSPNKRLHAIRHVFQEIPGLKEHALGVKVQRIVRYMDPKAVLVKALYFDKVLDDNWQVQWHQDRTINVRHKAEIEGFTGWTQKGDYFAVMPPLEFMRQVFTLRIHLDDVNQQNGALRILPGSHRKLFSGEQIQLIAENGVPSHIEIPAGGVHIMRPLILHASSKTATKCRRRVLHLEFSSAQLPEGLVWAELDDPNA